MVLLSELEKRADASNVFNDGQLFTFKMWIRSVGLMLDQGQEDYDNGNLEEAYIKLLKGSISVEQLPKLKDFNPTYPGYKLLRDKASAKIEILQIIKKELLKRSNDYNKLATTTSSDAAQQFQSRVQQFQLQSQKLHLNQSSHSIPPVQNFHAVAPLPKPSISLEFIDAPQLYDLLVRPKSNNVLILDVREAENFIHGHVYCKGSEGFPSGVVNIEPKWIRPRTSLSEIESYLVSFGTSSSRIELFRKIGQMDYIILMDHNSESFNDKLQTLNQIVAEQQIKSLVKMMKGGFLQWENFVRKKLGINMYDWIEIGEGSNSPRRQASSKSNTEDLSSISSETSKGSKPRKFPTRTSSKENKHLYMNSLNISLTEDVGPRRSIKETFSPVESPFDDPFLTFQGHGSDLSASSTLQSGGSYKLHKPLLPEPDDFISDSKYDTIQNFKMKFPEISPNIDTPVAYPTLESRDPGINSNDDMENFENKYPEINGVATPPIPKKTFNNVAVENRMNQYQQSSAPAVVPKLRPALITKPQQKSYNQPAKFDHITPLQKYQSEPQIKPYIPPPPLPRENIFKAPVPTPAFRPRPILAPSPSMPPPLPLKPHRRAFSPTITGVGNNFFPPSTSDAPSTSHQTFIPKMSIGVGMSGLKNLGNTCFMNSILQCLSATVPLARYFLDGSYRRHINRTNRLGSGGVLADSYAQLLKSMWSDKEDVVAPIEFKDVVGTLHSSFKGNQQQDSQEFLAFLLDKLHEDLNLARRGNVLPLKEDDQDTEGIPDEILLARDWERYRRLNWSIVVDMFQGSLKSTLKCLTCGKTSTTFNTFMYLTLPIPTVNKSGLRNGPVYIDECLNKFVEQEILEGADAWHCPKCKLPRRATKKLCLARLPMVLLIHLKRFSFDGPFRDKVETYVEFPISSLNLTPYLTPRRNQSGVQELYKYDLYGVSNHYGGMNGGHYIAQVKNSVKNQWYQMDDSRISVTNEDSVKSSAAYILFYVRTGPDSTNNIANWWGATTDPIPKI